MYSITDQITICLYKTVAEHELNLIEFFDWNTTRESRYYLIYDDSGSEFSKGRNSKTNLRFISWQLFLSEKVTVVFRIVERMRSKLNGAVKIALSNPPRSFAF